MIIKPKQTPINKLNLETSWKPAKERLRIFVKPQDVKESDDIRRNPKRYNTLLQLVNL